MWLQSYTRQYESQGCLDEAVKPRLSRLDFPKVNAVYNTRFCESHFSGKCPSPFMYISGSCDNSKYIHVRTVISLTSVFPGIPDLMSRDCLENAVVALKLSPE